MQILSRKKKDDDDGNLVGFFLFAENAFYPFLRKEKNMWIFHFLRGQGWKKFDNWRNFWKSLNKKVEIF